MTFSEFLNILRQYIGRSQNIPDFVVEITNQIIKESSEKKDNINPLSSKNDSMLYKIYSGEKNLPKKDAKVIFTHMDSDRFRSYLLSFSKEAIDQIGSELRKKNIEIIIFEGVEEIEITCSELFASIIKECLEKPQKNHIPAHKSEYITSTGSELAIPNECKICLCCKNWKGNTQDAYNSSSGTLGICHSYRKATLSIEGTDCNLFIPIYGRISHYQLMKKYPKPWY